MCKSETEEKFEEYRKYLLVEVHNLTSFISVYRQIEELKATHWLAMRWAPAFFKTSQAALWTAIIIWADKLFDPKSKRGLANFLSFVERNLSLFDLPELQRRKGFSEEYMVVRKPITLAEIQQDRERLAGVASLSSFKVRRDKFHAHFDEDYFFQRDKLQQDAPLRWSDLEELEAVMDKVLNRYSEAYDATGYVLKVANIRDLVHLLDRVR
jgi:HEPN superfamily AbiU2-like protein